VNEFGSNGLIGFVVLVVLFAYLSWRVDRPTRLALRKQKTSQKGWGHEGFEAESISRQIQELRRDYLSAVRSRHCFPRARRERMANARQAISCLSFFRKLPLNRPSETAANFEVGVSELSAVALALRLRSPGFMVGSMNRAAVLSLALVCAIEGTADSGRTAESKEKGVVTTKAAVAVHAHTNRLAREKSPYLLQHQSNPVDWYAWGEEAFAKAHKENKPIFLSIGYSTCHWCHVMERESFENEEVAKFLYVNFVSIKVDREERPDVDKIYMTFVQATTGQGGWPLNTFLTPDLKPFFGGTYFPPDARYGRPSFLQLLQHIHQLWQTRHGDLADSAEKIYAQLEEAASRTSTSNILLTTSVVREAGSRFKSAYDPRNGGFGSAPKFPQPSQP
jgi:hypothetical protein